MKPKVLLATTSSWYPSARLAMALHSAGCQVDAVCPNNHPLRKTGSVERVHVYRGLSPLRSLARAIAISRPDFIAAGDDHATQLLHCLYAREKRNGRSEASVCALLERSFGEPQSFPVVRERWAFMEFARTEGLRVPSTQIVHTREDLKASVNRMGLPAVLKADGTSGGDGVRIARTLSDAERAFDQLQAPPLLARAAKRALIDHDTTLVWPSLKRQRRVVNIQSFINGQEATSTVVCSKGVLLAALHFEVVNKVSSTGHATVVRLVQNAEMATAAETVVRRLGLSGFYGFDFMLEAETQHAYLIEINPRVTQVGHLTLGPGRDLPAALRATLASKEIQPAPKVTEKDTIALFPQEWIRDSQSPFLQSAYHDVPWEKPELVLDCVNSRQKQSGWYARLNRKPASAPERLPETAVAVTPITHSHRSLSS
ncbi:MAG TPA: ATP-grasp domain-containing protein [Candidatus Dormibacteraeota bacterium]|nr:ATP-grasp domain-containing protein [Candidatus Dormibacteraeota bacterium]